ncbi:MAG TPA: RNA-binding protein [Candidatus Paenibacillus intestinavium]|nr:RNA-binding protein [Candidatus Paenibacillus intestinavium]
MSYVAGTTERLQISREVSPYGYFLNNGEEDVLLPYTELVGSKPHVGDEIEVFIFFDSEDRICATMNKPFISFGEMARLVVADVHPRLGCFLEMGLGRQLLLPLSELPEMIEYRPIVGDEVFVFMAHDKSGRQIAKLAQEPELAPLTFPAPAAWRNQWVEGWVTKSLQMGSFVVIDGGVVGFGAYGLIPSTDRIESLRLGQRVKARVTFVREDGRVNLSMTQQKEFGRVEDADRILAFLKERPSGGMPYSDATEAELIRSRFGVSKGAFKRALGKLMREGIVVQQGSWTYLTENAPKSQPKSTDEVEQ